jgi:glycosyltransferase involved in cell wall biosynthesis
VGDGPERRRLEAHAAAGPLGGHFCFAGARHDIPATLAAMDFFALTSHNEANPVSILEAMACQRAVVATDVGSIAETLQHAKTGFLAEPDNAAMVAGYWQQLVEDPDLARGMGISARQRVLEHWSLEGMVAGYQQLIEEIYQRKCPQRNDNHRSPLPLAGTTG